VTEVDKRKAEITEKARELFFKYGIKSVTMDDLSRELGMSKKTLYQYYSNKKEAVEAVIDNYVLEEKNDFCCIVEGNGNAIEELLSIYRNRFKHMKDFNPSVIYDLQRFYGELWRKIEVFKNEFIFKHVCENIDRGIEEGLYRKNLKVQIIARLYSARLDLMLRGDLFDPAEYSLKEIMEEMFIYHVRGIASPKGIDFLENQLQSNIL